jgi:hypothetical protein
MKPPPEIPKFIANCRIVFHPDIHPDDAEKAVWALFWRTAKARKKWTPESILEDLFISSLANTRPGTGWTEDQIKTIERLSANKNFREKFARALEEGRSRMFDPVDVFILRNWRRLTGPDFSKTLPGLEDWSPPAACALIKWVKLSPKHMGGGWYSQRRKRLGLSGRKRYRVRDCFPLPDGGINIDHD